MIILAILSLNIFGEMIIIAIQIKTLYRKINSVAKLRFKVNFDNYECFKAILNRYHIFEVVLNI